MGSILRQFALIDSVQLMDNTIAKRQQTFRNLIRREQIQTYKKNRRKEMMYSNYIDTVNTYDSNSSQAHAIYWAALNHHEVRQLLDMPFEVVRNHLQMLSELVFAENNSMFNDSFFNILKVLVDYYEELDMNWRGEAYKMLDQLGMDQDECIKEQTAEIYSLTKIFTHISAATLIPIIGGIYFEINFISLEYVRKVVRIIKNILNFTFLDSSTIRNMLEIITEGQVNYYLNKEISKNHLLIVLENISFAEEKEIIQILNEESIFGMLESQIQVYGMQVNQMESLAGLYGNSISYLCQTILNTPVEHLRGDQTSFYDERVNENNLYLSIFTSLSEQQNQEIVSKMVFIANIVLKTAIDHNLACKQDLLTSIQSIIRNIISDAKYFPESQTLFTLFVSQCRGNETWLADYLELLLKHNLKLYYKAKQNQQRKGEATKKLKKLLRACQKWYVDLNKEEDIIELTLPQQIINTVFNLWCEQDMVMGYEQFISLMSAAVDFNRDLSDFLIFGDNQAQFLCFLKTDYQPVEVRLILKLLNSVCNRLSELSSSEQREYVVKYRNEWTQILQRVEGYDQIDENSSSQYHQLCMVIYSRIDQLLKNNLGE